MRSIAELAEFVSELEADVKRTHMALDVVALSDRCATAETALEGLHLDMSWRAHLELKQRLARVALHCANSGDSD